MIYGIGVDLVDIRRMARVIDRWKERFTHRVYTAQEIKYCRQGPKLISSLALRFAAKEAFSKAIGLGMRRGIRWRDIEVIQDPRGKPELKVTGEALRFCQSEGIVSWYVTLSDEGGYGVAVVVLERSV